MRDRGPSSSNQLNNVLVIDLIIIIGSSKRRFLRFSSVNKSSYYQQIRKLIPDFVIYTYFLECLDAKKIWCNFITHFEKKFKVG